MNKKITVLSCIAMATTLIFATSCNWLTPVKQPVEEASKKITDTLKIPSSEYFLPVDSFPIISFDKSIYSRSGLAAEVIEKQSLINFLQEDLSNDSLVTFQFGLDSLGQKHLIIYRYSMNPDSIIIFSPGTGMKCPPTCNYYSPAVLEPAR